MANFESFTETDLRLLWHALVHDDGMRRWPPPDGPLARLLAEVEGAMRVRGLVPDGGYAYR